MIEPPSIPVPDVTGELFHIARDKAAEVELALASFEPDGPSIGSQAWPGWFLITSQDPAPGTLLARWDSIRVTVEQVAGPEL